MGICSSSASVADFDKVAQSELISGKHVLEFIGVKWDSNHAKHLLKPFEKNSFGVKIPVIKIILHILIFVIIANNFFN